MTSTPEGRAGRRTHHAAPRTLRRKFLPLLIAACFGPAWANPAGPQVQSGQASFNQQGGLFSVTSTPNAIINWHSFSVAQGETARFIQQSAASSVLNRITGQDPSRILGALQSNGRVFLINPNGVLFGAGARVDVNGLVASSLAISDADFLSGKMRFGTGAGGAGQVANQGSITTPAGGQVFLIAPNVENSGIINAPNGDIVLAAGHSVQLADAARPELRVVLSAPADQAVNLGQVVAQGGRIGIYGALLRQRGVVSADSAVLGENGRIMLKASDTLLLEGGSRTSARGAGRGGEIALLGARVGLTGDARVDASGAAGGGTVLVGGDYQGANAAVPNARQSYVGPDAAISADATVRGDGGKVIVWGEQSSRVYGSISARGGVRGGDGGLIETSGHFLDVNGARIDAGAPAGRRGSWLIDPYDLEIVASGGTETLETAAMFGPETGGSTQLSAALLNGASANVTLQATHDITFNAAVAMAQAGVGLSAQAGNNINVNAAIGTNNGELSLLANQYLPNVTPEPGGGQIHINGALNTGSAALTLSGRGLDIGSNGALWGGKVFLRAAAGETADLGAAGKTDGVFALSAGELAAIHGDSLSIDAHSGINVSEALNLSALHLLNLDAGEGALTQAENAAIGGANALSLRGGSVRMMAPNYTGVVSGQAMMGDFRFRSVNGVMVSSTSGAGPGIYAPYGYVTLASSSPYGIGQDMAAPISALGLALYSAGPVRLGAANMLGSVAAELTIAQPSGTNTGTLAGTLDGATLVSDPSTSGGVPGSDGKSGGLYLRNAQQLTVGSVGALNGIDSHGADVELAVGAGQGIVIDQALNAGAGSVQLNADALALHNTVSGHIVSISTATAGLPITVGGACASQRACLSLTGLYQVAAPTIGIGSTDSFIPVGDIEVAAITSGVSQLSDRNQLTTRIGLLSSGNVRQTGIIDVQDLGIESMGSVTLGAANRVSNLAAKVQGDLAFNSALNLNIARLSDSATGSAGTAQRYDLSGIHSGGAVSLSSSGAIGQAAGALAGGEIGAASLNLKAGAGIGTAAAPLLTQVGELGAVNTGAGPINIRNHSGQPGALLLRSVRQDGAGNDGAITIDNSGKLEVAAGAVVSSGAGAISIVAHSPLTINGSVQTTSGAIALEAGATGSALDVLTLGSGASVTSGSGNITLKAGAAINVDANAVLSSGSGIVTRTAMLNTPAVPTPPPPPSADICVIAPNSALCQVLSPPTASEPVKPVSLASNTTVVLMNAATSTGAGNSASIVPPLLPGGAGVKAPDEKTPEKKDDMKKEEKKDVAASNDKSGMKNEPAKKTYCN